MFKLIARPAPYSLYSAGQTKDFVEENESKEILEEKYKTLLHSGNYWLIEILEPTNTGKMVSIKTFKKY